MSNARHQLEAYLKTLDIKGNVVDIGGIHWPVKGRTKSWNVPIYQIYDVKGFHKGIKADYIHDFNVILTNPDLPFFDIAFCLEMITMTWNPVQVLENINGLLLKDGLLYISTHFLFPHHSGKYDCLRYTRDGISILLEKTGFKILNITPRIAGSQKEKLLEWEKSESKIYKNPEEIGHLISAKKL